MTCAKRQVRAVLIGASGREYIGTNACESPQESCPRGPGDGYEKCATVCRQTGHAEQLAIREAGLDAFGGVMTVTHHYACAACLEAMRAAGVKQVTFTGAP